MIGRESYADPVKETWRGWQWNRICERLPEWDNRKMPSMQSAEFRRVAKTKTVLYLAGKEAMDLDWAARRGFCLDNMIAIDISEDAVKCVRGRGGIAIGGTLEETLIAWPESWKIDIVIADFCCGFSRTADTFRWSLAVSAGICRGTVVAINLQRGRDEYSNGVREDLVKYRAKDHIDVLKHRAFQWLFHLLRLGVDSLDGMSLLDEIRDCYTSYYRKESPPFDSVVFRYPFHRILNPEKLAIGETAVMSGIDIASAVASKSQLKRLDKQRRKITAARAVRTMRMN